MTAPYRYLHRSNALTYLSLCLMLGAMTLATGPHARNQIGALLAASVLLDTLDGRFARRFPRSEIQAAIGAQLDSLVDAVTFGAAPVVCLARLGDIASSPPVARLLFTAAAAAYAIAAVTRLACFNLGAAGDVQSFVGVPTTLAGLTVAALLLGSPSVVATTVVLACLAASMLAALRIPRPRGIGLIAFGAADFAVWVAHAYRCLG